ncbi:glucose 1-dehydrogenase [Aestuariibacter sp. AA17]|uniref:Glucose 1-dehydrogenase n=1 Tax=Fluctibacter corallii TaxID=2984329 RepID=A0ABT3A6H3_9ALTE|nr:glucose 1-dehydrogenase [Aestuariibacter sp. AA17]MCV2883951.1 glucose 1-dehydrogenase [Aestuariibacter sp. AA17]
MHLPLQDKHIVITGGASGIGADTAQLVAERGAKVVIGDLNAEAGEKLASHIVAMGAEAAFIPLDVTNSESVTTFYQGAIERYGDIDVGLNNAGIDHFPAAMHELPDEALDINYAVNVKGVWLCMKALLANMLPRQQGHIINLASVAGIKGSPMISAYCASKHAVIGLTKSTALEYAKANIRINAVCPSFVNTPMVTRTLSRLPEKNQQQIIRANAFKRLGEPHEVSGAIAWLCTDESSFMTGHSVVLDGGLTA